MTSATLMCFGMSLGGESRRQTDPDVTAVPFGKFHPLYDHVHGVGDVNKRGIAVGPQVLVIERVELMPVKDRTEIMVLNHYPRRRSADDIESTN